MKYIKTYEQNNFDINKYLYDNILDLSNLNLAINLPEIPNHIKEIYCYNNIFSKLPKLPDGLIYLSCWNNKLSELPELPSSLKELYCSNNKLTELPELPNLERLDCYDNNFTKLPELPNSLEILYCENNNLPYDDLDGYWEWYKEEHPDLWAAKQMGLY